MFKRFPNRYQTETKKAIFSRLADINYEQTVGQFHTGKHGMRLYAVDVI